MNAAWTRNRPVLLADPGMNVLFLVPTIFSPGFLSESNLRSTLVLAAFVGIVALGQTFVIIGGGIDLSIPWVLNSAAILMALLCNGQDLPLLWLVPMVLLAGGIIGLMTGIGVALPGVPAIVVILATTVILQVLILVHTGGSPSPSVPAVIKFLAVGHMGAVPVIGLVWVVLAIIVIIVLSRTAFGRHFYALGTSGTVAGFSGMPTKRTTILTCVTSGLSAAFAGILLPGYSGQAYLGMGDPHLFTSIAAVAIGVACIPGGSRNHPGTIAGALLLTILTGLLPALNLSSGAPFTICGMVILLTVTIGSHAATGLWAALFKQRPTRKSGDPRW
jgi:ribose transport system permease protein